MKETRKVTRRTAAELFSEDVELEEREELHTPQGHVAGRLSEASPEEHHGWGTPPPRRNILDQLGDSGLLLEDSIEEAPGEEAAHLQVSGEPEVAEEGEQSQVIPEAEAQLDEGERLLLGPRVDPQVPEEGEVAPGWAAIDSLGAWDTFLCKFAVLQEVPEQHKGAWAHAWVQVLRRWERAESEEQRDRALRWLAFLP